MAVGAPYARAGDAPPHGPSEGSPAMPSQGWNLKGTVVSTMDADRYTYVEFDTGTKKVWAAMPKREVNVGDTVYLRGDMPMNNFHSKTLDRDFELIYFTGAAMVIGPDAEDPHAPGGSGPGTPGHP
jgi:hypothetical protein